MDLELLGQILDDLRTDSNLSISRFAELCGVSQSNATRWLLGQQGMTLEHLFKVAEAVGRTPSGIIQSYELAFLEKQSPPSTGQDHSPGGYK
jgi:transcriptional regulator with XRE-family HTH domain